MRRRTKLRKKPTSQKIVDMLADIETLLLKNYNKERVENEKYAVDCIKSDPKHFFRYAK